MPAPIIIADLNGDGLPDLVVGNLQLYIGGPLDGIVGVLLNNSGPHSPTTTTLVSSLNPAPMRACRLHGHSDQSRRRGPGSVTFQDGGSTIATVPLANNRAACTATYTKGGYRKIAAIYSGDFRNLGSTSATLREYIKAITSKTVVNTSGSPSFAGQPVTFTATVTSNSGTIPDGDLVTFYDFSTAIGTRATTGGVATFDDFLTDGEGAHYQGGLHRGHNILAEQRNSEASRQSVRNRDGTGFECESFRLQATSDFHGDSYIGGAGANR